MPELKEEWRDIEGYEGLYQVSNLGRVRSLNRKVGKWKKYDIEGRVLILRKLPSGYRQIDLFKNGKIKKALVHRLVATAFISKPEKNYVVNHKDGDKSNNIVKNLEWCTQSENRKHAFANGLCKHGEDKPDAKLTNEQAEEIRREYIPFNREYGGKALARRYGVTPNVIRLILSGKTYKTYK